MDKKQLDFPTIPHENTVKVFYSDLNNLPKDSFYIVQELSIERGNSKQQQIELLKECAKKNGLDAIIITESMPIHKSYEKHNVTLLDIVTGSDPEPSTTVHYTVNRLNAHGIKYKSNINFTGLVKEYRLYHVRNNERFLIKTIKPINNKLPFSDNVLANTVKMNSIPYLINDKSRYWTYSNNTKNEKRRTTNPSFKTYTITRDDQQRVQTIRSNPGYKVDITYDKNNQIETKMINDNFYLYKEELSYTDNGMLDKKYIIKKNKSNKKQDVFIFDVVYHSDNSSLSSYKSLLYQ